MTPTDLAVPDVRIGPHRDIGHFRDAAAFDRFLEVYRRGMATLPTFEVRDVTTAFGTVRAYRFDGPAGPPVVLLPGRNAATPMYRGNLPTLLRQRTVYGIDLLGEAGLSVQHTPIRSADDIAHWLDDALAGLGLPHAHLLGVSIGGWTAMNLAVRRPQRVASLTLLDPVFTFAPVRTTPMLASIALIAPGVPPALRRRVLRWISGGADIDAAADEAALIATASRNFVLRQPIPRSFSDDQLRSVTRPVLALIAGRSVMLDAQRATRRARSMLPHGEVELWPAASHAINGEYPERIAQRAAEFWTRVDSDSPHRG
ncbi:alpha/beta fold hydrolase [Mycolicibacterium thermoresistibile]|jgi:pimeloyl-ACP methyl ester carboxylesterase|uniref:Carboxylesterase n=2 Tax=Mycolicibacterium thermoresistibile TaxID=1797 RepID=G7CNI6_MYCT3|nr:alpha/beta hydrolase [Mycolicibacterium thermoresistibile]EHI10390.1 carboxylesterase [Mycolicibacterium thermoresistibile ATCC 19527]MCV7187677.1 alpha/beta hydrolase [Mycolicibacterium thermoresistibile]GAT13581.1 carboxylesterase [Mycolicibacterium thermoresistibile]SNW17222.1 carboxylesterase [Mycolicibacterium thermoresistibile]